MRLSVVSVSSVVMAVVRLSAVLVCCAYFLSSSSAMDPHQKQLKELNEHATRVSNFPCLHPQPTVIPVHKLLPKCVSNGKAYFPDVTVLHRCDESTGSCTSGHTCAAQESHPVLLQFKATYMHDIDNYTMGVWQMETHEVLNHTKCACAVTPPRGYSWQGKSDKQPPINAPPTPSVGDTVSGSSQRPEPDANGSSPSDIYNTEIPTINVPAIIETLYERTV